MDSRKNDFKEAVHKVVRNIPEGKTLTYKEVAILAGHSGAHRAVGNLLSQNYDPTIPCHRVIRSDGKTGGYNRGSAMKMKRLQQENAL